MRLIRILKDTFFVSLFFLYGSYFSQNDSLPKHNSQFLFHLNAGYPVFNKFNIDSYDRNSPYWVKSKLKPMYEAGFEYSYKKFNIGLSASYIQHEFTGKNFEYDVFGQIGHSSYPFEKYNLYQKLNSNVLQVSLSLGVKLNVTDKHILFTNIFIATNLMYRNKVSTYYASDQFGYDTTKYIPLKEVGTTQNPGKWPAFGFIVTYNYKLTKRLFAEIKITSQFFYTNYQNDSSKLEQHGMLKDQQGTRDAYVIRKNIFIAPLLGLKYRLF